MVDETTTQVRIEMDDDLYTAWKRAKADLRANTNDQTIKILLTATGYEINQ